MEVGRNQNLGFGALVGRIGRKVPQENAKAIKTYLENVIAPQGVSVCLKNSGVKSSFIIDKGNTLTTKEADGFMAELKKIGATVRKSINPK